MPHILGPEDSTLLRPRQVGALATREIPKHPSKGKKVKTIKAAAICAVVGVALAGVAIASPASADPVSNSYVLVGSDTLQDVSNALTNGTVITGPAVRVTSNALSLGSFDSFGSTTIQTKGGGVYFGRPSGSTDGVTALSRSIDGQAYTAKVQTGMPAAPSAIIAKQVDIARSSSGPATPNASGALAYVPFGRDAVAYAYNGTSVLGTITTAQLKDIYSCTAGANVINGVTVQPLLPQSGSGTRKFFVAALQIADSVAQACVTSNGANPAFASVNENDGTALTAVGQIVPFSVASFVAQSNTAAQNRLGPAQLGTPTGTVPFTGSGTALVPNPAYYSDGTFGRDTYLVVEYARIDSTNAKFEQDLADLMDPTKAKSLSNSGTFQTNSGSVKAKFGFLPPSSTTILRANAS